LNVLSACQPVDGVVVVVLTAYSTVWLPGLVGMVTAFTVMLVCVGVPLTVGASLTAAPSPFDTSLAETVPVGVIAAVASVTFACGKLAGSVIFTALALYVVGVPVIATVTTVPLVLTAVPAVNPAGSPDTAKLAAVIDAAYVPLVSV
jgi:hypothetical protein